MTLQPASVSELSLALSSASQSNTRVRHVSLSALNRLLEHTPEDMTATMETGLTLAALQAQLASRRQWLPIDPANSERITVAEVLNGDLSGPRRFGYGTIREHLLGVKVVLADGRVICNGGKVVKNVAGYDLCKLFVGAQGSLGVIVEATFKLRPLPEAERFMSASDESLARAGRFLEPVLDSDLTPVVFDLAERTVILGFAGTREEVEWQVGLAAALGFADTAALEYEREFWNSAAVPVRRAAVLPSRLIETLQALKPDQFVARAGNGVIYYRGGAALPAPELPLKLIRRVKDTYDPKHILPEPSL